MKITKEWIDSTICLNNSGIDEQALSAAKTRDEAKAVIAAAGYDDPDAVIDDAIFALHV